MAPGSAGAGFSIVTPSFNQACFIERTLQSVLNQQTGRVVEYIVIDGGSSDGTLEILQRYAGRIRMVSEPDRGIYDAMNKGLAKATGEWVIFINAGDTFAEDDTVSKVFANDLDGYGVVYGDTLAAYSQGQVLKRAGHTRELGRGMIFFHQSAFVRTGLASELGFDLQYTLGADYDMILRLFTAGCAFHYLPIPVAVVDVTGVSNRRMVRSARDHFAIAAKYRRLTPADRMYHAGFIAWVALVSAGYKLLPVRVMHRISQVFNPGKGNGDQVRITPKR